MGMFDAINASASGMTAERFRLDIISNNIANVNTTRTADGGPYRRKMAVFAPRQDSGSFSEVLQKGLGSRLPGVRVTGVVEDPGPLRRQYDPGHPDADPDGYVSLPNVNIVAEMVDMMTASRAYEANATAVNTAKAMAQRALDIGR